MHEACSGDVQFRGLGSYGILHGFWLVVCYTCMGQNVGYTLKNRPGLSTTTAEHLLKVALK